MCTENWGLSSSLEGYISCVLQNSFNVRCFFFFMYMKGLHYDTLTEKCNLGIGTQLYMVAALKLFFIFFLQIFPCWTTRVLKCGILHAILPQNSAEFGNSCYPENNCWDQFNSSAVKYMWLISNCICFKRVFIFAVLCGVQGLTLSIYNPDTQRASSDQI